VTALSSQPFAEAPAIVIPSTGSTRSFRALRKPGGFGAHCEFRDRCGGSRARASASRGDPLAADPGWPLVKAAA